MPVAKTSGSKALPTGKELAIAVSATAVGIIAVATAAVAFFRRRSSRAIADSPDSFSLSDRESKTSLQEAMGNYPQYELHHSPRYELYHSPRKIPSIRYEMG
jgi:hypothetical protein